MAKVKTSKKHSGKISSKSPSKWITIKIPLDTHGKTVLLLETILANGWRHVGCINKTDIPTIGTVITEAIDQLEANSNKYTHTQ